MLSAAPGRLGRSLLARAGCTSYAPITGLRVLGGLAGRLGFLRSAAFILAAHVLGFRNTFLGERPPGALSCDGMGRGVNPEHSLM